MPANRYYLPLPLIACQTHSLKGDEAHHLTHVMRKKVGDQIDLVNGLGALALATIRAVKKESAEVVIDTVSHALPLLPPLILAQAILPWPQLKWVVQKATELGASKLFFFLAQKSEKKVLKSSMIKRLNVITIAALKQCGRLNLPTLHLIPTLDHLVLEEEKVFFGDVREQAPLLHTLAPFNSCAVIIGPEKGLTEGEISLLENKHRARGVKLSPYTLRAETAALAALACLSHFQLS